MAENETPHGRRSRSTGRRSARFRVHGTIGILIRAIRRNQRSPEEVVALLRDLPRRSSLHIRPGLLVDIIDEVAAEYGLS